MSKIFIAQTAVVAATTVGAGMFALPYMVSVSGWIPSLFYLCALGIILSFIHCVYALVLARVRERRRLVGLVQSAFGKWSGMFAFIVVVGGQILTLLVYLVLGDTFLKLLIPSIPPGVGVLLFWLVGSLPILFKLTRFARLEEWGVIGMFGVILLLLLGSSPQAAIASAPLVDWSRVVFPFGIALFALAGWTAVEPAYELGKSLPAGEVGIPPRKTFGALTAGTAVSVVLYLLFIFGILGSSVPITRDAISGFADPLHRVLLGLLGLFAVWTSYMPVGREAVGAFVDAGIKRPAALLLVLILPLALLGMGLSDFAKIVSLVGGVFLALQYMLILGVGKKLLRPGGSARIAFSLLFILLGAGVLYELYYFIVS